MVLLTGSHSVSVGSHWHFGVLARDALSTACVPALWSFFLVLRYSVIARDLIMQCKVTSTSLGLSVVS